MYGKAINHSLIRVELFSLSEYSLLRSVIADSNSNNENLVTESVN
jgi:hypothetical protein